MQVQFSLFTEHSKFIIPKSYNYTTPKKKEKRIIPHHSDKLLILIIQRIQDVVFN